MRPTSLYVRVCLLCLFAFCAMQAVGQTSYTTVVVFGDSLSDTGNIAHLTQAQFGIRYPSDLPLLGVDYTDGRFTDGTDTQPAAKAYTGVWVEQLATLLGSNVSVKNSLDSGTDYAYGDATTAAGTTVESRTVEGQTVSITLNNMGQQVTDYLATNPAPNAQTLYVLWGGANDLLNAALAGQDPTAAAQAAVANELALVQRLRAVGATNFMIPNLPPLGAFAASYGAAAVTALNNASGVFAQGLTTGVTALQQGAMGATLTVYQPDIFTLFSTVAGNPMPYGLGNITSAAQNISASPDTYLIWDGLHPTTTGHHLVAATAAGLLVPASASTTMLTVPTAAVAGQTVTISANVVSSKKVPATGLVTFFDGSTVVGSGAVDSSGIVQVTFTPAEAAGSDVSLTAVYAGDLQSAPSSSNVGTVALVTAAVGTSTTVTSSSATAAPGSAVTFTATVAPSVATYGVPTGTVTFSEGSTTLGTGTLSNGTATFTTSSLAVGTHQITATYGAAGIFGASTSAAFTETIVAPGFTPTVSPTSVTVQRGAAGQVTVQAASLGGYSGTVTLSCGTLPAHLSCSFASTSLAVSATAATSASTTLTIATNASTSASLAMPERPGLQITSKILLAGLLPGTLGLLCFGRRRKPMLQLLGLLLLAGSAAAGLSGCGGGSQNAAAGSYTVPVIFTPSNASGTSVTAQTVNVTVVVQ